MDQSNDLNIAIAANQTDGQTTVIILNGKMNINLLDNNCHPIINVFILCCFESSVKVDNVVNVGRLNIAQSDITFLAC